jgi:hypothetical protein
MCGTVQTLGIDIARSNLGIPNTDHSRGPKTAFFLGTPIHSTVTLLARFRG